MCDDAVGVVDVVHAVGVRGCTCIELWYIYVVSTHTRQEGNVERSRKSDRCSILYLAIDLHAHHVWDASLHECLDKV